MYTCKCKLKCRYYALPTYTNFLLLAKGFLHYGEELELGRYICLKITPKVCWFSHNNLLYGTPDECSNDKRFKLC